MGKRKEGHIQNKDNRGSSKGILLYFLICVVFGAAIGILLVMYLVSVYGDLDSRAMIVLYSGLAMCFASIFFNIIIHEAGHLVFGLLTGYAFLSFRVYSLTIIKEENKMRIKKLSVPGTAGQCLMAPPQCSVDTLPYRLYNYGGVILNLLVSFLVLLPMLLFPNLSMLARFLMGGYAAGGIMLGVLNGLPMKSFGIANDGYNVKSIKRDPSARRSFQLQLQMVVKQSAGIRLRDLPSEWFTLPEGADLTNVMHAFIQYMDYNRELDRLDLTAAKNSLNLLVPALPKLPLSFRNVVNMGFLFLSVLNGDPKEDVEQYYTNQSKILIKSAKNEINIRRIAYAYYKLHLMDEKAAELCRKKLHELAVKYPVPAEAEMNLMLADYVDQVEKSGKEA